ncbi:MAG: class I mannose-6-phosphate isomerase [Limnochordia bacterium]|jgi:mannose-6-phosphate isomerase|nr:class I mannose-6-phosphate isomerase [Limnochordia bacterium]
MKQRLYPLTFHPIYKDKIWGGRRFEEILARGLPDGLIGESWDVAAHPNGTSVVDKGFLAGTSLTRLVKDYGEDLAAGERFPLLLKLIDAQQDLSVQVHPDDDYVRRHTGERLGKTEMWYIVHSEPGAWIIWGLRQGVTKTEFAQAVSSGGEAILSCLNQVPVRAGELYPISAGLVHALGAGVVVAELQQNSDTTYRVYDWDRVDDRGVARELHVEQALDTIDFSDAALDPAYQFSRCAAYFQMEVLEKPQGYRLDLRPGFRILTNLGGQAEVAWSGGITHLAMGQSCLIPASLDRCELKGQGVVLCSTAAKAE